MIHDVLIVAGVDVGGARKGFHAVALRGGQYLGQTTSRSAAEIKAWCDGVGARVVGVDAPCRWSATGRARPAERELAAAGIHSFATPSREKAALSKFHGWMLAGAELYSLLEMDYPLFDGDPARLGGPLCFETFPQAAACALAGEVLRAKNKRQDRRALLVEAGIDPAKFTNIDAVDAALCALVAHRLAQGDFKTYGDAATGLIVAPKEAIRRAPDSRNLDAPVLLS